MHLIPIDFVRRRTAADDYFVRVELIRNAAT